MSQLKIYDSFYTEAATNIAAVRKINDPDTSVSDIEKILRAYVNLGQTKQIQDFNYLLTDDEQIEISNKVLYDAKLNLSGNMAYQFVLVDLQIMETLASEGKISPCISQPLKYQNMFDQDIADSNISAVQNPSNDSGVLGTVQSGINKVFSSIGEALKSGLSSLGIDPSLLIYIALGLAALILYLKMKK
jgi:hypothetical protein